MLEKQSTSGASGERRMAHFDLNDEIQRLRHGRIWDRTGHNTKTLAKEPRLRILLTVLRAGEKFQEKPVEDRISVQIVSGNIKLHASNRTNPLPPGHLVVLEPGVEFGLEAQEDSAFLLSISWSGIPMPPEPPREQKPAPAPYAVSPTRPWKRL